MSQHLLDRYATVSQVHRAHGLHFIHLGHDRQCCEDFEIQVFRGGSDVLLQEAQHQREGGEGQRQVGPRKDAFYGVLVHGINLNYAVKFKPYH